MIKIQLANTKTHYNTIAQIADTTWREHYIPIIGIQQVEYMLNKFQSAIAIEKQVGESYEYYLINFDSVDVGYISIKKEANTLFLSKIYVLSNYRGKKIGKAGLQFVESKANDYKLGSITLTVNKNNTNSIAAYQKLGFKKQEAIVMDIGNGFVMDDYKMVKTLD